MRIYEALFIIKPDVPDEEVDQRLEALKSPPDRHGRHRRQVGQMGQTPAGV